MTSDSEVVKEGTKEKRKSRKKLLYQTILKQVEFYFSDANLAKDRMLTKMLNEEGKIDLSIFLSFNKIRALTSDVNDLAKALRQSDMLSVNEDNMTVKRTTPIQIKENQEQCTIYVEQLPPETDHDWLKEMFSPYGEIDYVSIPKYKNGKAKGFAFIEYSTPEAANSAIENYKEAGSYLPTDMEPGNLCSIMTFSEGNNQNETETESRARNEVKTKNDGGKEKKEEILQAEKKVSNEGNSGKKRKHPNKESPDENPPQLKKLKTNEQNEESSGNEIQQFETDEDGDNLEEGKKKKNRKKKKKPKKEKITAENSGLQILSKADWKRLRNKYLNIQKEKMKMLKKHLQHRPYRRVEHNEEFVDKSIREVKESNKPMDFPQGLIVKAISQEPVIDVKKFKEEVKGFPSVKYVDVKEGAMEIHFRLGTPDEAKEFHQSAPWQNLKILQGKEEEEYWNKIQTDRSEKLKKKSVKERGKKKLIRKAEKALGKHIKFDDD